MPASRVLAPLRHQLLAATAQRRQSRRLPEKRGSCSYACFQAPEFQAALGPQQYANLKLWSPWCLQLSPANNRGVLFPSSAQQKHT